MAQRDPEDDVLQEGHLVALTEAGVRLHSLRERAFAHDVAAGEEVTWASLKLNIAQAIVLIMTSLFERGLSLRSPELMCAG